MRRSAQRRKPLGCIDTKPPAFARTQVLRIRTGGCFPLVLPRVRRWGDPSGSRQVQLGSVERVTALGPGGHLMHMAIRNPDRRDLGRPRPNAEHIGDVHELDQTVREHP